MRAIALAIIALGAFVDHSTGTAHAKSAAMFFVILSVICIIGGW